MEPPSRKADSRSHLKYIEFGDKGSIVQVVIKSKLFYGELVEITFE